MTRSTVRVRLTALYSGLFLAAATILIVTVNLLLKNMLADRVADIEAGEPPPVPLPSLPATASTNSPTPAAEYRTEVVRAVDDLRDAVLRFQWGVAAVTIAALTIVSIIGGWWLAGRILRRLHRITATAQQLSLSNLHERIALTGPRDELKELADTFDAMLERLERSVDSQRRFVANASHELRTPLAIQRAAIQIGLDDPTPRQLAQVRERLLEANRRTERLMDGLLVLAQSERGLDSREPVALDAVVHQVAGETPADNIAMTLDTEPATVRGDSVLLARLIANLLQNAVQYNVPGGSVHVSLAAPGILTVHNTGPPVPEERISELFEPFRRLDATRTRSADGAGLGLSIAASIAQAHDATITARPNPTGGLEVIVRFTASPGGMVPEMAGPGTSLAGVGDRVLNVGLTGGIGSGKSEVVRMLAEHGAVVIDSDVLAREAVAPGTDGLAAVIAEFGCAVVGAGGALDRARLAELVFAAPARREALERIIHPYVRARARELAAAAPPGSVVVHDVPLLVEQRLQDLYDVVVVVDAPVEVQVERLVRLKGMSEHDVHARIAAQATRDQRLAVADFVLDNSGTLEELATEVAELWTALLVSVS